MKEDLEKRLDQLLNDMPKPEYDLDAWLTEDETETFDRIVTQRRRQALTWWRSIAAAVIGMVGLTGVWLWRSAEEPAKEMVKSKTEIAQTTRLSHFPKEHKDACGLTPSVLVMEGDADEASRKPMVSVLSHAKTKPMEAPTVAEPADSLDYYINKIERELAEVDESLYIERMQRVIQADERLQRLVNTYIVRALNKENQPHQAAVNNPVTINEDEE